MAGCPCTSQTSHYCCQLLSPHYKDKQLGYENRPLMHRIFCNVVLQNYLLQRGHVLPRHLSVFLFVCLSVSNFTKKLLIGSSPEMHLYEEELNNLGNHPLLYHKAPETEKLQQYNNSASLFIVYNCRRPHHFAAV